MTVATLACRLGTSEATAWRQLRNRGLTLRRLDEICAVLEIDLDDILSSDGSEMADHFTTRQERILASDREISLLFFTILHGARREDFVRDFGVPADRVERHVQRLVRLGLLTISTGGKLKPTTTRSVRWQRGGPLAAAFEATIKTNFFAADFSDPGTNYVSQMIRLSNAARARVETSIIRLQEDILRIAREDSVTESGEASWTALLLMANPMPLEAIRAWVKEAERAGS